MFQNMRNDNEKVLRSSFLIAHRIAKKTNTYSDGDFVKECLIDVAQEICPKMVSEIQKISLSRWTVAKRIDVLADGIYATLKEKIKTLFHGSLQRMKVRIKRIRHNWLYL